MKVFIYSEARQNLAKLLVIARKAEVEIRRRDGTAFSLISKKALQENSWAGRTLTPSPSGRGLG